MLILGIYNLVAWTAHFY